MFLPGEAEIRATGEAIASALSVSQAAQVAVTYADVCGRMRTYADVCLHMQTYADVSQAAQVAVTPLSRQCRFNSRPLFADVC